MEAASAQLRPLGRQTEKLRARMIRETEDYLAVYLPGRDVPWPPDLGGRRAGIGQSTRPWELRRLQADTYQPATEQSFG
jgi:hypothetical protein